MYNPVNIVNLCGGIIAKFEKIKDDENKLLSSSESTVLLNSNCSLDL